MYYRGRSLRLLTAAAWYVSIYHTILPYRDMKLGMLNELRLIDV